VWIADVRARPQFPSGLGWVERNDLHPFSILFFGGAATIVMAANFYYTTPRPICQEKNRKKIK
jgi:hypothetical protein